MKFGVFYEHQLPRPWTANSEYELFQNSLTQVELADKLGYDYMLGSRAPLSGRILPLVGARGLSGRRQPAHQEHPARPWHRPVDHQPAASGSGTSGDVGSDLRRSGRTWHGRGRRPGGTASVRRARARQARPLGRGGAGDHPDVHPGQLGIPRQIPRLSRRGMSFRSRIRSRIRRYGSPVPTSARSARPANGAWARWGSASCRPTPPGPGCTNTTTCICISPDG